MRRKNVRGKKALTGQGRISIIKDGTLSTRLMRRKAERAAKKKK
jgi:hypothetical protein